jgi:hypothetical protein
MSHVKPSFVVATNCTPVMTFFCVDEYVARSHMPSFLPAVAVEADVDEAENSSLRRPR